MKESPLAADATPQDLLGPAFRLVLGFALGLGFLATVCCMAIVG